LDFRSPEYGGRLGLKTTGGRQIRVKTFWCIACGYLESLASVERLFSLRRPQRNRNEMGEATVNKT
jgi:hypothetical protein